MTTERLPKFPALFLIVAAVLVAGSSASPEGSTALPPTPKIEGHFTAPGGQVPDPKKETIEKSLGTIQDRFKTDMAIYLLPKPVEADLERFGKEVFANWNIGKTWKNGGLLVVVSSDGLTCKIIQSPDHPVLPKTLVDNYIRSLQNRGNQPIGNALMATVSRCERFLGRGSMPRQPDSQEQDPARGRAYALGSLITLAIAGVAVGLHWGRTD